MIKYSLGLIILLFSLSSSANDLDAVKAITKTPEHLSGHFTQSKYLAQLDTSLNSTGTFHYDRDKEITWHTQTPIDSTLKLTPTQMLSYQDGKQVNQLNSTSNPVVSVLSNIFFGVMTAKWQVLERYFSVVAQVKDGTWQVTLTPLNANIGRFAQKITLEGGQYLQHITLYESDGNRTHIMFNELKEQ